MGYNRSNAAWRAARKYARNKNRIDAQHVRNRTRQKANKPGVLESLEKLTDNMTPLTVEQMKDRVTNNIKWSVVLWLSTINIEGVSRVVFFLGVAWSVFNIICGVDHISKLTSDKVNIRNMIDKYEILKGVIIGVLILIIL